MQIIESRSFARIKDLNDLARIKGRCMVQRNNNLKVRSYLNSLEMNEKKEVMMLRVRQNCQDLRMFFEA